MHQRYIDYVLKMEVKLVWVRAGTHARRGHVSLRIERLQDASNSYVRAFSDGHSLVTAQEARNNSDD